MLDKIKAKIKELIEKFKGLNLFLKYVIVIFALFIFTVAIGSPPFLGHLLSALIIGAIGHYLYLFYKANKKDF